MTLDFCKFKRTEPDNIPKTISHSPNEKKNDDWKKIFDEYPTKPSYPSSTNSFET
jgi:hypothetical protein